MPKGTDQWWTPAHATQGAARVMTELGEIARAELRGDELLDRLSAMRRQSVDIALAFS
jgi:NTP pyrophosphatase (non-canonical NTP hydrolase)